MGPYLCVAHQHIRRRPLDAVERDIQLIERDVYLMGRQSVQHTIQNLCHITETSDPERHRVGDWESEEVRAERDTMYLNVQCGYGENEEGVCVHEHALPSPSLTLWLVRPHTFQFFLTSPVSR